MLTQVNLKGVTMVQRFIITNNMNNEQLLVNAGSNLGRNVQGRNWVFTLFKDGLSPEELSEDCKQILQDSRIKYFIYQIEKCEQTGRIHSQGYCMFSSNMRFNAVKCMLGNAHIEKRKGSHSQARDYCSKEETRILGPFESGDEPKPGKRNDLLEVKDSIDNGADILDVANEHFQSFCRYSRAFREYISLGFPIRKSKSRVEVHWGVSGAGKTYGVYDKYGVDNVYNMPRPNGNSTIWFDGYNGKKHKVLLIDDFYGWAPLNFMLQLLDAYPFQVQVKGSFVHFSCEVIWITSNDTWENWYKWNDYKTELKTAFARRLDLVQEYTDRHESVQINF